ncbi:MAG: geranylgeranyl reductase family protein [Candidatus Woesearchaeota archaeon]
MFLQGDNLKDRYDIIVAGAGPAGSEFAYRMAKAGFSVLVLEKEKLDREKPCGGGIPAQEAVEFRGLPAGSIERRIRKSRIISPDNSILDINLERGLPSGAVVRRSVYDRRLQRRAEDAGAEFMELSAVSMVEQEGRKDNSGDSRNSYVGKYGGVSVKDSRGRTFHARIMADASGAVPVTLSSAPHKERRPENSISDDDMLAAYHLWISLPEKEIKSRIGSTIEMYCGNEVIPKGYAWIFPKKDAVSVGIGTTVSEIKRGKLSLRRMLDDFMKAHPVASAKLKGGKRICEGGGLIPAALRDKLYHGRIILIGDAGGFANPLNGGGIYQARKSAVIAAKHCIRFLRQDKKHTLEQDKKHTGDRRVLKRKSGHNALEEYQREAREIFHENSNKWDIKMRNFFWDDSLLDETLKRAGKNKGLRDLIGGLFFMTMPRERIYKRMESEMLDMIHSMATRRIRPYKDMARNHMSMFSAGKKLDRLAMHPMSGTAKRLRMSLILLSCDIFRREGNKNSLRNAARLAPVFELLHTASLVHDDIIDNAGIRRGKKTLHNLHGTGKAIVAGDYLIGKTYSVFSEGLEGLSNEQMRSILSITGSSAEKCCRGQLMDMEMSEKKGTGKRNNKGYSNSKRYRIRDYITMISLKTGSMIEGAMMKGAVIAGASREQVKAMGRIGLNMGIAFQIIDDSIDLLGNNNSKSLQNDLRQGKITPMLIHAMKNSEAGQRRILQKVIGKETASTDETRKAASIYRETGAVDFCQRLAGEHISRVLEDIREFKAGGKLSDRTINIEALSLLEEVADIMGYWGKLGYAGRSAGKTSPKP